MKCMSCKNNDSEFCLWSYLKRDGGEGCRYYEQLTLYLCGRITGDRQYRAKFLDAENELYDAGFHPVNPAALVSADTDWKDAMRVAITHMLHSDGVALLPDWKKSKGARIEASLARKIGIPVKTIREWEKPRLI